MSKQCLDVHQMQHLQELGLELDYNTMLSWIVDERGKDKPLLCISSEAVDYVDFCHYCIPAYTLQDVLDALPKEIEIDNRKYSLIIEKDAVMYVNWIGNAQMGWIWGEGKCINKFIPLIDYAYSMLVECIENGYIKTDKNE